MFPHLHDIHAENADTCLAYLEPLLKLGNKVLVVSKPGLEVMKWVYRTLAPWKAQVLFRFTIGTSDPVVLKYWEPNAPALAERVESLAQAKSAGYQTSLSMEPMLDGMPENLLEAVRPHLTHSAWLGTANFLANRLAVNTTGDLYREATQCALALARVQTNTWARELYARYKDDPLVRWKDSIKRLVGLPSPVAPGLDV